MRAEPDLLKVAEVAARLRFSRGTVYNLIRSGALPAYRPGPRQTRVTASAVDAYLARNEQPKVRHLRLVA